MIKETYKYICDVCGKEVKQSEFASMGFTPVTHTPHSIGTGAPMKTIDFCQECWDQFIKSIFDKTIRKTTKEDDDETVEV